MPRRTEGGEVRLPARVTWGALVVFLGYLLAAAWWAASVSADLRTAQRDITEIKQELKAARTAASRVAHLDAGEVGR